MPFEFGDVVLVPFPFTSQTASKMAERGIAQAFRRQTGVRYSRKIAYPAATRHLG
jgi:hypothetical protein